MNAIYLRSSGINFLVDHDRLLHEYYHVFRQWNTGNLTASRYIVESMRSGYWENRFEVAARTFARENIDRFDALLRNTTEGQ